jgi:hypothetical protein
LLVAQADTKVMTGDVAAQDFTVQAGSGTQLFAGGGNDLLRFGAPAAAAAHSAGPAYWTTALQHGATLAQVADAMLQSVEMVGQQGTPPDWNFSV